MLSESFSPISELLFSFDFIEVKRTVGIPNARKVLVANLATTSTTNSKTDEIGVFCLSVSPKIGPFTLSLIVFKPAGSV